MTRNKSQINESENVNQNKANRVLRAVDKRINEIESSANGLLAGVWRKFLYDYNVTPLYWSECVDKYIDTEMQQAGGKAVERANIRSALNDELFKPGITFKSLIKGLKIIKVDKLTITLNGYRFGLPFESKAEGILNPELLSQILKEPLFRENAKPEPRRLSAKDQLNQAISKPEEKPPVEKVVKTNSKRKSKEVKP